MGYLYFCPHVVFGFRDIQCGWGNGKILSPDSAPPGMNVYAGEINKGYNISPIVGIECQLSKSGQATYDPVDYEKLIAFMETCKKYYASQGISEEIIREVVVPSFYTAMSGDWNCDGMYTIESPRAEEEEEAPAGGAGENQSTM